MFFRLDSWELALILFAVVVGATVLGVVGGRYLRQHSASLREPFGVLQAALLGLVGLILAFGLSLAVGRHETRRAVVVDEANTIGTTFLRAQTLAEPVRGRSLALLKRYTDTSIHLSKTIPGSREQDTTLAVSGACSVDCGGSPAERSSMRRPPVRPGCTSTASTACSTRKARAWPLETIACPRQCSRWKWSPQPSRSGCSPCTCRSSVEA
jgi:hypothetical protein